VVWTASLLPVSRLVFQDVVVSLGLSSVLKRLENRPLDFIERLDRLCGSGARWLDGPWRLEYGRHMGRSWTYGRDGFIEVLGRAIEPVSLVDLLRALVDDDVLAAAIERVQKCLEVVLARRLTEVGVTNGSGSQSYVDGAIFLGRHGTHHLENRVLLGLWLLRFLDLLRLLLGDFLRLLFFGFALRVLLLILIFLKLPLIMLLFGHLRQLLRFFLLKRLRFDLIKQWHLRLHSVAVRDVTRDRLL
jgi:hypothetical protein